MNSLKTQAIKLNRDWRAPLGGTAFLPGSKLALPTHGGIDFVPFADIEYFKADGNYTYLFMIQRKEVLVTAMISRIESKLPIQLFARIHHKYIINMQYLLRYEKGDGGRVILVNDITLPVSREKKKPFLKKVLGGIDWSIEIEQNKRDTLQIAPSKFKIN